MRLWVEKSNTKMSLTSNCVSDVNAAGIRGAGPPLSGTQPFGHSSALGKQDNR